MMAFLLRCVTFIAKEYGLQFEKKKSYGKMPLLANLDLGKELTIRLLFVNQSVMYLE